jgi:hypothetical protein
LEAAGDPRVAVLHRVVKERSIMTGVFAVRDSIHNYTIRVKGKIGHPGSGLRMFGEFGWRGIRYRRTCWFLEFRDGHLGQILLGKYTPHAGERDVAKWKLLRDGGLTCDGVLHRSILI